jgi:4-hydroxy-tetrahydrodipicolinate synthase
MDCVVDNTLARAGNRRLGELRGSITALVTPFANDRIDEEALTFLCRRQIERGTAALVACGTTGEASTLTHDEQLRVIEITVKAAAGQVPVIAGAGSNCTRTAVELTRQAERLGADAILAVVPYYNRPSQEGLYQHFKAMQSATERPVILYDVPARTGATLAVETIERLAALPNIVGLKDASGDLPRARALRQLLGKDFLLFCGDDGRVADFLAAGAQGCISVTSNVAPALCAALHRAWAANEFGRFHYIKDLLAILSEALFVETNPIPVKWALARLGLIGDELRLPLTGLAAKHQPTVLRALDLIIGIEADMAAERSCLAPALARIA